MLKEFDLQELIAKPLNPIISVKSGLKEKFETELRRLGHISSAQQDVDFYTIITRLGDTNVIAKTIADKEVWEAYNLLVGEQFDADQEIFLQNILVILKGISTPFQKKK